MKLIYKILWAYWPNKEYHGKLAVISYGDRFYTRWHDSIKNISWWLEVKIDGEMMYSI